ncbi:MAG: HD domain-containing protein [Clostridia bacterium]|nr:HD domain-containing protein [Clostridia bacterium]
MQNQLARLIKNQMFEGFLLVKNSEQRTSSNGSKFLDMTLSDVSGEFNAKMWDGAVQPPKAGTVIKVRAMMNEYNGRPQLRVDKLRAVTDKDEVDMSLLVPCAPEAPDTMEGFIRERVAKIADAELRKVVEYRLDEAGDALSYYPAAQKLHHAERSGLLHHTSTMLRMSDMVCDVYPQLDRDLLAAGVVLHDLCKITELMADESGVVSDYSREGLLLGHLVQGVSVLMRVCDQMGVREELKLMLSHMILSHHDLPEYGSPRRPMFPEAEVLHILDLLDARMFEMSYALNAIAPGTFTDRIWSLERKLYRREKPANAESGEEQN